MRLNRFLRPLRRRVRRLLGYGDRSDRKYGVRYVEHNLPDHLPARAVYPAKITLENAGNWTWRSAPPDGRSVALFVRCGDTVVATHPLPCGEVEAGRRVTVHFALEMPSEAGQVEMHFEMVEHQVTLFRDRGVAPLSVGIRAEPPLADPQDEIWHTASRCNPWHYQPTRGISRGAAGRRYPVFASRAKGCRLWDASGREYIDYVMGWGSTLLGYADDRVQRAVAEAVEWTAPVIPYPHVYEMDVAQMICEDFPSAEMVIFGKNGSDVCTLAARTARVLTARKTILFCGYHGWQDGWVEHFGFDRTGVPPRSVPLTYRFQFNNYDDFDRLYRQHRSDLAAVMLEPSGPMGDDGIHFGEDADREFLQRIAGAARNAGALLIFDEIVTGYRYPGGSVQKATGVVPDMTCLGKALASGMPLSALAGRADVFKQGLPRTWYGPTFKWEIYSFAAARAAIPIYRQEPVAERVWEHGRRLKEGINRACREAGLAAECKGPPFRVLPVFAEPDAYRLALKKALYQQELLAAGLSTYNGIMLPSYAHDEEVLERALTIIGGALRTVAEAEEKNDFDARLDIPPLFEF